MVLCATAKKELCRSQGVLVWRSGMGLLKCPPWTSGPLNTNLREVKE